MQKHLLQQYEGALRCVQVMPVDEEDGIPLHEIYGSVLVEEDMEAIKKTRNPDEPSGTKTLDSVRDMFYVKDKLSQNSHIAKRIVLHGEAGHGKTVLCLKILECWSKVKLQMIGTEGGKGRGFVETKHISKQQTERTQSNWSYKCRGDKIDRITKPTASGFHLGNIEMLTPEQRKESDRDPCSCLSSTDIGDEESKLQSCLSLFDLVFYVPLRHAMHGTSSIVDLVCGSVSECDNNTEQNIKLMLRDGSIRCLVILDGLDEYRVPDTCRVQGFPDTVGLVNCTLLCTMRPWQMISLRLGLNSKFDKVVSILGLKSSSVSTVISNILVNFYGFNISSVLYKETLKRFCAKARLPELRSLIKIPLILTTSCLVWNEEGAVLSGRDVSKGTSYFMTLLYLKLTEMTVTRAENKHDIVKSFLVNKRHNPDTTMIVPCMLSGFETIVDFFEIIMSIGRLALQGLLSDEPHLVFLRNKLEREIGWSKVELALKAGILSQTKAPGLSYQQRVSVSFYHKSMQEFIAALYVTCGGADPLTSFCGHCNTVKKIMELSNMIMFVCGLDPLVGCQLSKHIKDVVNNDVDIIRYRERRAGLDTRHVFKWGSLLARMAAAWTHKVRRLYAAHCKWFREMKHNLSYTQNTDHPPILHVTDVLVYLVRRDRGNANLASELVSMEGNSIVSVYVDDVPQARNVIQHLPWCKYLTRLYVTYKGEDIELLLVKVLPQLVQLQHVTFDRKASSCDNAGAAAVHALQQLPSLESIELINIILTNTVTLPPQVRNVELRGVYQTHFVMPSLLGCNNLTSLTITSCRHMEDRVVLALVLPQLRHLQVIHYGDYDSLCDIVGLRCRDSRHAV